MLVQGAGKVDEARAWMKGNAEAHANSKQVDQTNKQLHTSLRREMERAKQASPSQLFVACPLVEHLFSCPDCFHVLKLDRNGVSG